jgi:hypothetical protein
VSRNSLFDYRAESLEDLAEAAKQPINGVIKIETEEGPKQIELEASQVAVEAPALQENYGISSLQRLQCPRQLAVVAVGASIGYVVGLIRRLASRIAVDRFCCLACFAASISSW